jgi:hypothetical protein
MKLLNAIGKKGIKKVIEEHPQIGKILERYSIDCIKCSIGTCILKEVVAVHCLGEEIESQIEEEIYNYLNSVKTQT